MCRAAKGAGFVLDPLLFVVRPSTSLHTRVHAPHACTHPHTHPPNTHTHKTPPAHPALSALLQGVQMAPACQAAGLEGFPTWVIGGERLMGEQTLEELEEALAKAVSDVAGVGAP